MLLKFSEMLRYQLYECNTDTINIDKEINYIRNYVSLQQTRNEENLIVTLNIDENVKGFAIVPLLFIAFIENAFKYVGSSEDHENRVDISFTKKENTLIFTTFNSKERIGNHRLDHHGIGIHNVKRRLELLYPEKHDLKITESEFCHLVVLKLQLS